MNLSKKELAKILDRAQIKLQSRSGSAHPTIIQAMTMNDLERLVQTAFTEGMKFERGQKRED